MTEKYTIKDIAKLAGVSKGTVDRVLHKRGKVSKIALDKVTKILNEIDYKPNLIARNLKNNKRYLFYILMPDPDIDPYWAPCLEGIKNANEEYAPFNVYITSLFFNPESTASFLEVSSQVISQSPDAVLLPPLFYKESLEMIAKFHEKGILVATFNNAIKSKFIKYFVGQDLIQSGKVAAKLLESVLKKGDIAIIHLNEVYKNAVHMQEKEKGFRAFFDTKNNTAFNITTCKIKQPYLAQSLTTLLKENPTINGIFVTTSKAYQVAEVIHELKLDIAIVGYDLLENNLKHLEKGTVDFLIHQNQKMQVYLGITYLLENLLFSKEISDTKLLPIDIINSENAKYYLP
ncbi:LacI family DNA-binding transcriptional regulator [Cellulophaga sp. E16_2]|uniref:LacI family DNA-binding transcriptional regulator n=1 Tax=Cellulophaga sp. E16_2 TaxID=2789297 RepID=UPI001A926532|nr:LacI family DNA-binding transcriptional regulator [Cellulophaga sp. E16_2]MBO0590167.1 LacI family DNA-binding transcriptional regulator [Cellulophaga sp. E16_2]